MIFLEKHAVTSLILRNDGHNHKNSNINKQIVTKIN